MVQGDDRTTAQTPTDVTGQVSWHPVSPEQQQQQLQQQQSQTLIVHLSPDFKCILNSTLCRHFCSLNTSVYLRVNQNLTDRLYTMSHQQSHRRSCKSVTDKVKESLLSQSVSVEVQVRRRLTHRWVGGSVDEWVVSASESDSNTNKSPQQEDRKKNSSHFNERQQLFEGKRFLKLCLVL